MRAVPSTQFELPLEICNDRSRWSLAKICMQIMIIELTVKNPG